MDYEYLNQFNLTTDLSQAISNIISKKENEEYVCKIINCSIPKHKHKITTKHREQNSKKDYKKNNTYSISKQNYKYLVVAKKRKYYQIRK